MGSAIDVYIGEYEENPNAPCDLYSKKRNDVMLGAEKIVSKYQYGHFDGMNDIYEYSNSREDIPQAKYIHVNPLSQNY